MFLVDNLLKIIIADLWKKKIFMKTKKKIFIVDFSLLWNVFVNASFQQHSTNQLHSSYISLEVCDLSTTVFTFV